MFDFLWRYGKMKKVMFVMMFVAIAATSLATPITIVNGDFESYGDNDAPPTGWTDNTPTSFWSGMVDETGNPTSEEWIPELGDYILTTARQSVPVDSQPVDGQLVQTVDLSALAADIDSGDQTLLVNFIWASDDYRDTGTFSLRFFDVSDVELGSYSVALDDGDGYSFTGWLEETVGGLVPVSARSVTLQIDTTRSGGSETNIWIDNISGNMVPEPATLALLGLGCLVLRRRK
jgi:hypothetical protein